MPSYIVRFKKDASQEHIDELFPFGNSSNSRVKKKIKDKGGEITHEHKLVKAITASFPDDHVGALDAHPAVEEVEEDKVVTTQA